MQRKISHFIKKSIALIFTVVLIMSSFSVIYSAEGPDTSALEKELNQLKEEAKKYQNAINTIKNEKYDVQTRINNINLKIVNLEAQINIVSQQINAIVLQIEDLKEQIYEKDMLITQKQGEIDQKEKEIAIKEFEYNASYDLFKERIRIIYINGNASTLEMLFGAGDFTSFFDKIEYLQKISEKDKSDMNYLIDKKTQIISEKEQIENDKAAVIDEENSIKEQKTVLEQSQTYYESKQQEQEAARTELNSLKVQAASELQTLESQEKSARMEYETTQKEMQEIQAKIEALIKAYAQAADTVYVGGEFVWPAPGYTRISMPFNGYPGHTGTDIVGKSAGLIYGAPFVAAGNGTVIVVIYGNTGYGNYVIVDHGGGVTTLYAHASAISVTKGQQVSAGQQLGKVGSTGNSTGPHLHFEVRINGKPVNAMSYFTAQ
ncbi:MAG: peptidoglycan DD-metalloendopeptidase family protein [Oscillospiraceae bacterium]|nr:peptidoglycan DD-metalloendopeptidase family protein [Oscillospiraceae bacterium]